MLQVKLQTSYKLQTKIEHITLRQTKQYTRLQTPLKTWEYNLKHLGDWTNEFTDISRKLLYK